MVDKIKRDFTKVNEDVVTALHPYLILECYRLEHKKVKPSEVLRFIQTSHDHLIIGKKTQNIYNSQFFRILSDFKTRGLINENSITEKGLRTLEVMERELKFVLSALNEVLKHK